MRARNIKPGFFKNDDLADNDPMARLLFIGLWMMADREGRLIDKPRRLKGEIFPYDNCNEDDVNAWLDALHKGGFITRYEAGGMRYIQVNAFSKHQNPNPKETASSIPAPSENGTDCIQNISGSNPDCIQIESGTLQEKIQNVSNSAESLLLNTESPLLNPESIGSDTNGGGSTNVVPTKAAEIAKVCRSYGINCQPHNPIIQGLANQDIDLETLGCACQEAKDRNATSIRYVVKVLENWAKDADGMKVRGAKPPGRVQSFADQWAEVDRQREAERAANARLVNPMMQLEVHDAAAAG